MNVSLTPRLEEFIREQVESGLYNNASEVVRESLRKLEMEMQQLTRLRDMMSDSREQFRQGKVVRESATFWDDLNREVDARIARGQAPDPNVCP